MSASVTNNSSSRNTALIRMIVVLSLVIVFALFVVYQVSAQATTVDIITRDLASLDVAIIKINTVSRFPLKLEFIVQSKSETDAPDLEDKWNMQIVRREATLQYRGGARIESYTLNLINTKGETISSEENYLYPDDISQKLPKPSDERLQDEKAAKSLRNDINYQTLLVDEVRVIFHNSSIATGQLASVKLVAADLEQVNAELLKVLDSLFQSMPKSNTSNGINIALLRVTIVDKKGVVFLDLVRDIELGTQQWYIAEGVNDGWFPHPPAEEEILAPTSIPTTVPIPTPFAPYPLNPSTEEKIVIPTVTPIVGPTPTLSRVGFFIRRLSDALYRDAEGGLGCQGFWARVRGRRH